MIALSFFSFRDGEVCVIVRMMYDLREIAATNILIQG
jgi:hypothetical protein